MDRPSMAEKPLKKQPRRSAGRPFQPGVSGNPAGKPKGVRSKSTVFGEQIMQADAEEIVKAVVTAAKNGDGAAMRLCIERLIPVRKGRPIAFDIPRIDSAAGVKAALGKIAKAMATGHLTVEEAAGASTVIEATRKVIEIEELEARIQRLEQEKGR
jgi:hypothetical protein